MEHLRAEYVALVERWNELSAQRDRLLNQLQLFDQTRIDETPSIGELSLRQQIADLLEESLRVAHRGSQLAEIRKLFRRIGGRKIMLRNQHHWFHNIKELRATRLQIMGSPGRANVIAEMRRAGEL